MDLNASQRVALEAAIESALSKVPMTMEEWHHRDTMKKYGIKEANDFVFGYVLGSIYNSLFSIIFISEGRAPNSDELALSRETKRTSEIKNAILLEGYHVR